MNSTTLWLFVLSMAATPPYNLPVWQHAAISTVALVVLARNTVNWWLRRAGDRRQHEWEKETWGIER
mgnify:FL=1